MDDYLSLLILSMLFLSCHSSSKQPSYEPIRLEQIKYFNVKNGKTDTEFFQQRLTYFYDNGKQYRYMIIDSSGKVNTDYFYYYDEKWIERDAKYKEDGEDEYSIELFSYNEDSTRKTTTWIDSAGAVYYTMIEDLDSLQRPFRASFTGTELHGYDSLFYTSEGFERRIFFTNTKGRRMNDRTFRYTEFQNGEWLAREKIMGDTVQQVQVRSINYTDDFIDDSGLYYPGTVSSYELSENVMSLTKDASHFFLTKSDDWKNQFGYIGISKAGLFMEPEKVNQLDTIYNGAISPSGNQIIYCKRLEDKPEIWLIQKNQGQWQQPINLTEKTGISGGYFNWYNESEVIFYVEDNNGDLVYAEVENGDLRILRSMMEFNTAEALEFSPFIDPEKRFFIFTRYLEGDFDKQGFYISYNKGTKSAPAWGIAVKIQELPYGWGSFVSHDLRFFYYTDGNDIYGEAVSFENGKLIFD